jgi:DNA-binding NtrC family response regulator
MYSGPALLAIIEMGGYPNFIPLYEQLGYRVDVVNSQRKARNLLKKSVPDVVVAEYIFQSDFRDRTSNLETLMAVLQRHPEVKVVVFYLPEQAPKLAILTERFPLFATIPLPVTLEQVETVLAPLARPG